MLIPGPGLVLPCPVEPDFLAGITIFQVFTLCFHENVVFLMRYNHDIRVMVIIAVDAKLLAGNVSLSPFDVIPHGQLYDQNHAQTVH